MPNTRRRRFSVHNEIAGRQSTKVQNGQPSHTDPENEIKSVTTKSSKHKSKIYGSSSKNPPTLEVLTECESAASILTSKKESNTKVDKENAPTTTDNSLVGEVKEPVNLPDEPQKGSDPSQLNRERTPLRREKHPRQHRIKVRSPKRRIPVLEQGKSTDVVNNFNNKRNTGTAAINWDVELEVNSCGNVNSIVANTEDDERPSTHSLDDMCRICHGGDGLSPELGSLISTCLCRGTVGRVHVKCLERWLTESGKSRCELCGTRYVTRRVHRYGVPRALVMWILSQNAKQLMVDSLGIMLMSPLAVLAAWLSGRTLAGLMTQESHVTPWPLASTFVLACMTLLKSGDKIDITGTCRNKSIKFAPVITVLSKQDKMGISNNLIGLFLHVLPPLHLMVCYYCWIVSAATRHALSWWIWYRSQYEVRLQLQENEE